MSEVNIVINGRSFRIACDDGQEPRVIELGRLISDRVDELRAAGAGTNDSHLLVLTSLMMADELFDIKEQLKDALKSNKSSGKVEDPSQKSIPEERMVKILDHLSGRLEGVTQKIQSL